MALATPTLSGSESAIGITRESPWGTLPTTGADPNKTITGEVFFYCKEANIESNFGADAQLDDMSPDREIQRIIANGAVVEGSLRFTPGPETLGYFLTSMFGTPATTTLANTSGSYEGAYQHIWWPGRVSRTAWPVGYSIESRLSNVRSKLVRGGLCRRIALGLPQNAVATCEAEFLGKDIIFLSGSSGGLDTLGRATPAKLTGAPTFITETEWHWKNLVAYPQIDSADREMVTAMSYNFGLPVEGIFTGGSGIWVGTYRVDNFRMDGNVTLQFENEALWEKFVMGTYFRLDATLKGDLIQGAYYNQLTINVYSAKATANPVPNRVGSLEYDFPWTAREDPTQGKSVQITLINTVSSYA